MNFLFATVLVLLLVAPGLFFLRLYHAGRFSIRYSNLTITDQVFRSIVPGLLLQAGCVWLINRWQPDGYHIRLDVLGILLLGAKEDRTIREAFSVVERSLGAVVSYELALLALGALGGWAARKVVRYFKLDRRTRWFRYDNEWYYLLTGEILETTDIPAIAQLHEASHIDFVVVDALVKLEDGNILYSGILANYELAADGGLRTIYLYSARRKFLRPTSQEEAPTEAPADVPGDAGYYPVAGNLLTLPYAQLLNLNITYFLSEEDAQAEGDTSDSVSAPQSFN